jgi:tRNA(Arg) A34 adenosine deaminase TadA
VRGGESGVRLFQAPTCHHAPEVYGGLRATQARDMLRDFFAGKR